MPTPCIPLATMALSPSAAPGEASRRVNRITGHIGVNSKMPCDGGSGGNLRGRGEQNTARQSTATQPLCSRIRGQPERRRIGPLRQWQTAGRAGWRRKPGRCEIPAARSSSSTSGSGRSGAAHTNTTSAEEAPDALRYQYVNATTRGRVVSTQPGPSWRGRSSVDSQLKSVQWCGRTITYCLEQTSFSMQGGRRRSGPRRSRSYTWTRCRRSPCRRSRRTCTSPLAAKCRVRDCQRSGWSRATTIRARTIPVGCPIGDSPSTGICPPPDRMAFRQFDSRISCCSRIGIRGLPPGRLSFLNGIRTSSAGAIEQPVDNAISLVNKTDFCVDFL